MTDEEIAFSAISSMREIAAMAAEKIDPENPGATMIALLISAYADAISDYVQEGIIPLAEACHGVTRDMQTIQMKLMEDYG